MLTFAFFQIKQRFFSRPRAPEGRAPGRREEVIGRWERRGGVVGTYHVGEVHAHGHVAVAAVVLEAVRSEEEGHEGDVGGVHRLEREAVVGAVEVGIGDEILDGLEHLLQEGTLDKTGLKHGDLCLLVYVGGVSVPAWYGADGAILQESVGKYKFEPPGFETLSLPGALIAAPIPVPVKFGETKENRVFGGTRPRAARHTLCTDVTMTDSTMMDSEGGVSQSTDAPRHRRVSPNDRTQTEPSPDRTVEFWR